MNKLKIATILALALVLFTGCADDDDKQPKPPELTGVTGDPWLYVKNTQNNGTSGSLPEKLFESYDDSTANKDKSFTWEMAYYGFREQKTDKNLDSQEHFLKGSRKLPVEVNQTDESGKKFSQKSSSILTLKSEHGTLMNLFKVEGKDGYVVQPGLDILFYGENQTVVHYSYTPDLKTFSILFYMTSKEGGLKALIAVTGTKSLDGKIHADKNKSYRYNYIAGDYLMRWDQSKTLQFDKCFLPFDGLSAVVDKSYDAWTDALKGRLDTTIVAKSSCPPFSDLNTQTIQYIDEWAEVVGPDGVMGAVWPRYFQSTGRIVDADMFLYKKELSDYLAAVAPGTDLNNPATYTQSTVQGYFNWVVTHEFGHMLGLDHKMEGPYSIMSYDKEYFYGSIFSYDRLAIENLYPLRQKAGSGDYTYPTTGTGTYETN